MKFIFVRHGKTHFNEINLTQGWCDSPLSKLGVKQVENMSLQLKDYSINKAYTSPLGRAVETSEIILQGHNIAPISDKRLKEVNFGILEGILYANYDISVQEVKEVEDALSKKENKTIRLRVVNDPSLIGGIKVEINNRVFDGSIKNKVALLKKELLRK